MKKSSDFTKASTIYNVQKTLRVMDGELEKKREYKYVCIIFLFFVVYYNYVQTGDAGDS